MPRLILGPLLRRVGEREATVWVETDEPCEVDVLGTRATTFEVEGHYYAIVVIAGLEPGSVYPYTVALDGHEVWPPRSSPFPSSVVRTLAPSRGVKLLFGSCRVSFPHEPPHTLSRDEDERGRGVDALYAFALRMRGEPVERWPNAVILLGDQVYADEVSPRALDFIRARRDVRRPPGEEVADFEEYTRLYWEAWSDPVLRWFFSTVPTAMLFDDHDVHDDWNISRSWRERMSAEPWWGRRIEGAFMSYWLYQHLGNMSPDDLERDEILARIRTAGDGSSILRDFARRADREPRGRRWSFSRDFGRTRLLAIDCRAGRVLEPDRRLLVDDEEWQWIVERSAGDFDHLLLAMSDPYLLPRGVHDLQAWNEALCNGAWGRRLSRAGERLRESADLDHWAAFEESFHRLTELVRAIGAGERGRAPASIVALAGDIHHAYLAEVAFPGDAGVRSKVYQAVCSPIRNPLTRRERWAVRTCASRAGALVASALAAAARVRPAPVSWRLVRRASFANQIGTIELSGREAVVRLERALPGVSGPRLGLVFEERLA